MKAIHQYIKPKGIFFSWPLTYLNQFFIYPNWRSIFSTTTILLYAKRFYCLNIKNKFFENFKFAISKKLAYNLIKAMSYNSQINYCKKI